MDGFGTRYAILNCLYGAPMLYSEDIAAGFARALNDWLKAEWLDRDPRLRASITVPPHAPELAAEEIERAAEDRRFVQVLLPVMGETPPGRRINWPVYAAAERAGLPVAFHAGSAYRHPPTPVGWPSYLAEDYAAQATAFQTALTSLIAEGVFRKFPELTVVFAESGVAWLPAHLWRLTKYWRGLRMEVPWVDRSPEEIVRERVRFTIQPFDAPEEPDAIARLLEHLGSDDMLLFATDYPHWQFDGMGALPEGLPADLVPAYRSGQSAQHLSAPRGGKAMTVEVLDRPAGGNAAEADTRIADCDIHPSPKSLEREIPSLPGEALAAPYGALRRAAPASPS